MLRKIVGAAVIAVLFVGVAFADEIRGVITKVDGKNVTFASFKKGQKGDEQTLPVAADVKVVTGKRNKETKKVEAGDAIADGLKDKRFSNISEKGVPALIVTDSDNKKITEIRVLGGRRKNKQ